MARGINKVIIVGTAGADPEIRYTASGTAIAKVSIATNESWNDKQTGQKQERTEWHRVTFFGTLAEIVGEYLKKGKQVYVEGSLRTDKWTDKEGVERYTTNVIASEMQLLGGRSGGGRSDEEPESEGQAARQQTRRAGAKSAPANTGPAAQEVGQQSQAGTFDDDAIPF